MGKDWTNVGTGVWTRHTATYEGDTAMPALGEYIGALLRLWHEAQGYDDLDTTAGGAAGATMH